MRRSVGFGISSKLDALSLSEVSSLSANLEAADAMESLLSFIEGGGPREANVVGTGSGAGLLLGGSALTGEGWLVAGSEGL